MYGKENLGNIKNKNILHATSKNVILTKRFYVQQSWWFLDIMTVILILLLKLMFLFVFLFCFYYYYYLLIILRLFFIFHILFPGMSQHLNVQLVQVMMTVSKSFVQCGNVNIENKVQNGKLTGTFYFFFLHVVLLPWDKWIPANHWSLPQINYPNF